jgi:hypothetical protein
MKRIKVFDYIEDLDAFLPTKEYERIADYLGVSEWTPVVWIGRYFARDNDFGEHWFDNWDERKSVREKAEAMGIDPSELLIINPARFQDGKDGPCHSDGLRKTFWTDVLCSLEVRLELIVHEARENNEVRKEYGSPSYVAGLEERITGLGASEPA